MFALVFDGKVVELGATEFPVSEGLFWTDITGLSPQPEVRWSYDGAVFAPPPSPPLGELKDAKLAAFKIAAVPRMAAHVLAWDTFDEIEFLLSFSNMLDTASATASQNSAIAIVSYVRDTVRPKINAFTTEVEVNAVDATLADPFGDGTPWPL